MRDAGGQFAGQCRGPVDVDVDDGEMVGAEVQQGMADGRARPARAEEHHVVGRRPGQAFGESGREAGRVGVVADGLRPVEDDRVDRPEGGGRVVHDVEVRSPVAYRDG